MNFDFSLDPIENLDRQINAAEQLGIKEPTAMSLATSSKNGQPHVRAVLFKGVVRDGISFYTNYESPKAKELDSNPAASLLFFWAALFQQIIISGQVERLTRQESEAYFNSRPRLSQIGAWASEQSQEIPSFDYLSEKVKNIELKFKDSPIPCPPNWGGYHLIPTYFEFWFGREGRLHERFVYERKDSKSPWRRYLKSP